MINKLKMLRLLYESGGVTSEYPFLQTGVEHVLDELLAEQLVELHPPQKDCFRTIKLTARGQQAALSAGVTRTALDT